MKTMKTYKIYAIRLAWKGRYLFLEFHSHTEQLNSALLA